MTSSHPKILQELIRDQLRTTSDPSSSSHYSATISRLDPKPSSVTQDTSGMCFQLAIKSTPQETS